MNGSRSMQTTAISCRACVTRDRSLGVPPSSPSTSAGLFSGAYCREWGLKGEPRCRSFRRYDDCRESSAITTRGVQARAPILCPKPISYGDFQHSVRRSFLGGLDVHRKAALHGLVEVLQRLLNGFALRGTARNGRHLSASWITTLIFTSSHLP